MYDHYYKILDLKPGATQEDIKQAFRKKALLYHPDRNPAEDAQTSFVAAYEAYEILTSVAQNRQFHDVHAKFREKRNNKEYYDYLRDIRRRAREQSQMKYEKWREQHEAYKKSGIYDALLVLNMFSRYVLVIVAVGMIIIPIYLSFTVDAYIFFAMMFFWIIGISSLVYIYSNRKHFFKKQAFYYKNPREFWKGIQYVSKRNDQDCYYCKGYAADARPYKHSMLKVSDIKLSNSGPLLHNVNYRRKYHELNIPRGKKALIMHRTTSMIKILAIIVSLVILDLDSILWRAVIGGIIGGIVSTILLFVTRTRSNHTWLLTPVILTKLIIILVVLFFLSTFLEGNVYTSEFLPAFMIILLFLLDILVEPLLSLLLGKNDRRPLIHQPSPFREYYEKGYRNYLDIPIWTIIYPLFRWLF